MDIYFYATIKFLLLSPLRRSSFIQHPENPQLHKNKVEFDTFKLDWCCQSDSEARSTKVRKKCLIRMDPQAGCSPDESDVLSFYRTRQQERNLPHQGEQDKRLHLCLCVGKKGPRSDWIFRWGLEAEIGRHRMGIYCSNTIWILHGPRHRWVQISVRREREKPLGICKEPGV